jgi:hypothetical protein
MPKQTVKEQIAQFSAATEKGLADLRNHVFGSLLAMKKASEAADRHHFKIESYLSGHENRIASLEEKIRLVCNQLGI